MILTLLACTGPGARVFDLDAVATMSPLVGTVATVTWTTDAPGTSVVEFGPDESYGYRTPGGSDLVKDHSVVVAGMPAGSEWHWRALSEIDGETRISDDNVVTATRQPADVPSVTVTGGPTPGWTLVAWNGPPPVVLILDGAGRPCWWHVAEPDTRVLQARLSRDGLAVLLPTVDQETQEARIARVPLDGGATVVAPAPALHHDFLELADGRYAYIASDPGEHDGVPIMGDAVRVTDPASGEVTEVWSAWDDLEPVLNDGMGVLPTGEIDWTHANGLAWDPDTETWYVSLHYLSDIVGVRDGRIDWSLASDFALDGGEPFEYQHAPFLTDEGFLLVSNGDKADTSESFALGYALDVGARTWRETWRYSPGSFVNMLGNVEPASEDDLLVSLGDTDELRRVTSEGEELQRLVFPAAEFVSYAHPLASLGGAP